MDLYTDEKDGVLGPDKPPGCFVNILILIESDKQTWIPEKMRTATLLMCIYDQIFPFNYDNHVLETFLQGTHRNCHRSHWFQRFLKLIPFLLFPPETNIMTHLR